MNRKIDGTFFEFKHHNTAEGKYWNPSLDKFQAEDWRNKVREISALGMEYIVIMATALFSFLLVCYDNQNTGAGAIVVLHTNASLA